MEKYNRLTVVSKPFKKSIKNSKSLRQDYWLTCKCECGIVKDIRKRDVIKGRVQSCGCLQKESILKLHADKEILTGEESALRVAFQSYKSSAKDRGLSFKIDLKEFNMITSKSCFYCNSKPSNIKKSQNSLNGEYIHSGIDRVNNSVGYESNNIVPCCKMCNLMKKDLNKDDFINHCRKITNCGS